MLKKIIHGDLIQLPNIFKTSGAFVYTVLMKMFFTFQYQKYDIQAHKRKLLTYLQKIAV